MSDTNKTTEEVGEEVAGLIVHNCIAHNRPPLDCAKQILSLPEIAILHPDQSLPEIPYPECRGRARIYGEGYRISRQCQQDMVDKNWRRMIKK